MGPTTPRGNMDSSLNSHSLALQTPAKNNTVAESWDDEAEEADELADTFPPGTPAASHLRTLHSQLPVDHPAAPPPTPSSPRLLSPAPAASSAGRSVYHHKHLSADMPGAPPPTPASPHGAAPDFSVPGSLGDDRGNAADVRPEKTTATAARMIAAGLGVKATRTEEERQYDKAVREQERQRRDKERLLKKQQEEEREKAQREIWGED